MDNGNGSIFFNTALDELNGEDTDFGKVIGLFSFVAIFLASIGLLGLSLFLAEQRKQEIGIRKVFGASVTKVIKFIAIEYIGLIAIANLIVF
ncbi:MAG TPA: FtsX-like permease family protein [Candidatus Scalindua sp.]|nr:FtsX-like permease family protein [Candidatus Scalindua sp.]